MDIAFYMHGQEDFLTKRLVEQSLTTELLSHTSYYSNFLTRHSIKVLQQDYLMKKMYKNDDMDILLSTLSNAFQSEVTLYQYRGNVKLVDKLKPGRVESIESIDLFYHNEHYELVVPLVHTDEKYSSEVDDEDIHPDSDSVYRNKTFAPCAYQKQCPESAGETTSYLHEDEHLPILFQQIETLSIEWVYDILIREKVNDKICEKVPHGVERSTSF